MKATINFSISIFIALSVAAGLAIAGQPLVLQLMPAGNQVQLSWPSAIFDDTESMVFPEYEIQYSTNLTSWKPVTGKLRGVSGRSGPVFNLSLDYSPIPAFYRIQANLAPKTPDRLGDGGAEVFGYNAQFNTELAAIGEMPVQDFATNGANIAYLPQLSWDPTTAQFWSNFKSQFHLSSNELAVFTTNGFVVSERLASDSFGRSYYSLFNADLPAFVTADSVLHAWHGSYQSMLEELEEVELSTLLAQTISNMSLQLPQIWQSYGQGPLRDSILDADCFLTVANSLWVGQQVWSTLRDPSVEQEVTGALSAISRQGLEKIPLFGSMRTIDFSQFKVRGHYDASDRLRHYFKTMMWCGRIDRQIASEPPNQVDNDVRQLGTAVVLQSLLTQSGQFTNWSAIEQITRAFVGITDSMTFAQLGDLLSAAGIRSLADVTDLQVLTNLQTRLLSGELGAQSIHSDFFYSPLGPEQIKLPRSFTFCGQKFVLDSWAFSQVVFDRILWTSNGEPAKVFRRKPTCLDVAFSVFGDNQVVPEIAARILDTNGVPFRDGLPYQHNLLAVRKVVDDQDAGIWTNNIYTGWLSVLRALAAPTVDPKYPEAMRRRAWAMKTLNTQLGSWTELRHDTLLYAKQSYTEPGLCGYPAGFVEPRPEYWDSLKTLANLTAQAIGSLPLSGWVTIPSRDPAPWSPGSVTFSLADIQSSQVSFLNQFAGYMTTLAQMARKELAQEPFSADETQFLKDIMENSLVYTGIEQWNGWYPKLFYKNSLGGTAQQLPVCAHPDPQVVDVHTDLPDPFLTGDPGAVIHESVGNVNLLVVAVDNGPDRMVYAGPVFSHYEFEEPSGTRLSDAEWATMLGSSAKPPPPGWTRSYLVPQSQ